MRRRVVQLALGLLTAAALLPPAVPAATVRAVRAASDRGLPGTYAANRFVMPLSFSVKADAWRVEQAARREMFLLHGAACCEQNAGRRTGILAMLQPSRVIDPAHWEAAPDAARPRALAAPQSAPEGGAGTAAARGRQECPALGVRFRSRTPDNEECANFAVVSFGPFSMPGERGRIAVVRVRGELGAVFLDRCAPRRPAAVREDSPSAAQDRAVRRAQRARATAARFVDRHERPDDDDVLFREAARRSSGALQVSVRSELYGDKPDSEQQVARAVQAGRLPVAWDATRVWDIEGVLSFQGLQAPFLVDSAALMERVIASPARRASGIRPRLQGRR